jgi:transcription termination/antitermination protein NusG
MAEQESPGEQAMPSDIDTAQTSEESGSDEAVDIRPSHEEAADEAVSDVVEAELVRAEIDATEEEAVEEATEAVISGEMAKAEIDAAEEEIIEQTIDAVEQAEQAKEEIDAAEEVAVDDAIAIAERAEDDATQEAAADAAIDAALAGEAAKAEIEEAEEALVEDALEEIEEAEQAKAAIEAAEEVIVAETADGIVVAEEAKAELDVIEEAAAEEAIVETVAAEAEAEAGEAPADEAAPTQDGAVDDEDATPAVLRGPGEWYVVHTYAGYENKVRANLGSRIQSMQMEEKIFDVVIPMEDVMEIKGGKKQVVQKKVFPGYLLVRMVYDNDSWYVVRNTPGVTGFVSSGTGTKPTPLSPREVEKILAVKKETAEKPQYRLEFEEGDVVRIIVGPFADFTGTISEINVEQSKLKVMVNIFDRETPVELAFDQVAKA